MSESENKSPGEAPLRIGGYELVRELGHGGQATVFSAVQISTGRRVAIKFIYGGTVASAVERTRLDQEVRILAALDHPNIVSVFDRGETADGSIYFVMPFVQGVTFNEYLDAFHQKNGPPGRLRDLSPLLKIFARICEAVNAAHLRGIVHRDLKPSNIIVDAYGEPHILDFGLARSPLPARGPDGMLLPTTRTGEFVGSLQWASPEQAEGAGAKVDIRSDVYSLGVMFYEILTGDFPYDVFGSVRETLNNIVTVNPEPPSRALQAAQESPPPGWVNPVTPSLDAIAMRALAKNPEDRYQSAGELARSIQSYLEGAIIAAAPVAAAPLQKDGASARRIRAGVIAAVAAMVLVAVGAIWLKSGHGPRLRLAASAAESEPVGYVVEGANVAFEFDPSLYDNVRLPDGRFDRVTSIGLIRTVAVVGPFNNWGTASGDWTMKRDEGDVFHLFVPLKTFAAAHSWPFKFVVNGNLWVGAPLDAPNRELVVTDAATYNLLLFNPLVHPSRQDVQMREFRARINAAWPGQGPNLTLDDKGGYHFIFNYLAGRVRVGHLEPLRGIPLVSLNLGDTRIRDFAPLRDAKALDTVVMNEATYEAFVGPVLEAVRGGHFKEADEAVRRVFEPFERVPAFHNAALRMREGIALLKRSAAGIQGPPEDAPSFGGHHYIYVPADRMWSEAGEFAKQCGGDLASVGSIEEQEFLTANFGAPSLGRRIWLGGTDEAHEGFWAWSNGERWIFDHWTPPEPDNANRAEHCLAMKSDGWWTDNDGALKFPFIVEWDE